MRSAEGGADRTRVARVVLIALTIATLGAAVYVNSLTNPFVYDDFRLIVENRALATPGDLTAVVWHDITRPLVNLSYAFDAAIWGIRPLGFHITNVLLHALNVALLFAVAWGLALDSRRPPLASAVIAAVAFAVHPLLSQAVGYISARADLLCATFVLLAWLAARRFLLHGRMRWAGAALVAWLFALASKEVAAMLPFVLLVYDRLLISGRGNAPDPESPPSRLRWLRLASAPPSAESRAPSPGSRAPSPWRRRALLYVPMIALVAAAGTLRIWLLRQVEYADAGVDSQLILVAVDTLRGYLQLLAWPTGQAIFHAVEPIDSLFSARAALALAAVAAGVVLVRALRRVNALVPLGFAWFVLFLVPSAVLFVLGRGEALAEHRVYLASTGLFLAAGSLVAQALRRTQDEAPLLRWVMIGVLVVGMLQLGVRTIVRNTVWSDPERLWREAMLQAPGHWLPHLMLGEVQRQRHGCAAAEAEYRAAIRLRPEEVFPYTKLGSCLVDARRLDEAEMVFVGLRDVAPTSAEGPTGLAIVAMLKGAPLNSRMHLQEAIVRDPAAIVPRQLLVTLEEPRDPAAALAICEEIRRLAPNTPGNEDCIRRTRERIGKPRQ
jgi:hypothetical protein